MDEFKRYKVTYTLLFLNIAVYLLDLTLTKGSLMSWGMKHNGLIIAGQWWRLLTSNYLHGGILHLFMNMNALYNCKICENLLSPATYLGVYTASGIAGSLLSFALSPAPAVGASGAIMGIFGALWMTLYDNRGFYGDQASSIRNSLASSVGLTFLVGLMIPLVDNWGHLGGVLAGVAGTYLCGPQLQRKGLQGKLVKRPRLRLPSFGSPS